MYRSKLFATSVLETGGWSTLRTGCLITRKTWHTLYRRLVGPRGRSGRTRKISPSRGFDPRMLQHIYMSCNITFQTLFVYSTTDRVCLSSKASGLFLAEDRVEFWQVVVSVAVGQFSSPSISALPCIITPLIHHSHIR
jgi:hypothetical protein